MNLSDQAGLLKGEAEYGTRKNVASPGYDQPTSTTTEEEKRKKKKECPACHGVGFLYLAGAKQECETCEGSGEVGESAATEAGEVENSGEKCASCGHAHDGDVCDDCDCAIFRSKRENGLENMACPVCQENEPGGISGLIDHVMDDHDMSEKEAEDVIGVRNDVSWTPLKDRLAAGASRYGDKKPIK